MQNGLLSALPYLSQWIVSFVISIIADSLRKKEILSMTVTRKLFTTMGIFNISVAFFFSNVKFNFLSYFRTFDTCLRPYCGYLHWMRSHWDSHFGNILKYLSVTSPFFTGTLFDLMKLTLTSGFNGANNSVFMVR